MGLPEVIEVVYFGLTEVLTGGKHTFKNLRFTNGKGASDTGGACYIRSISVDF